MANWFKDTQRVLVYPPGAGGEYITACYNGQDLTEDYSYSKGAPGKNRYASHNGFPGHDILFEKSKTLPLSPGEWTEENRLNFSSESELKEFINKEDPEGKWKKSTGNPDANKVIRKFPIGEYETGNKVLVEHPIWFPTHYDYGCFREPVWKWLDFDDLYWMVHWSICIFFKSVDSFEKKQENIINLSQEFNVENPHTTWHQDRHIYRNYYNKKFPNSRISVDDKSFREELNYIEWAELNLEAMEKYLVDNNARDVIYKPCWDYLKNAMPR